MDGPPVVLYTEPDQREWRGYDSWPPAHERHVFTATPERELIEGDVVFGQEQTPVGEYRPDPTIGALAGTSRIGLGEYDVALDQHDDDLRGLSFTGEPATAPFTIGGAATVTIRVSGALPPRRIVARLSEVDADGRSTCIALGVRCPRELQDEYLIQLEPACWRVGKDHRLRLTISDSDFPRLFPVSAPEPLGVEALLLDVPVIQQDSGIDVDPGRLPQPISDVPTAGVEPAVGWTLKRDVMHDRLTVRLEGATPPVQIGDGHKLSGRSETEAVVTKDAPAASTIVGTKTMVAEFNNGEVVECAAWTRCTATELVFRGKVEIDGTEIYSRVWQTALEPS